MPSGRQARHLARPGSAVPEATCAPPSG